MRHLLPGEMLQLSKEIFHLRIVHFIRLRSTANEKHNRVGAGKNRPTLRMKLSDRCTNSPAGFCPLYGRTVYFFYNDRTAQRRFRSREVESLQKLPVKRARLHKKLWMLPQRETELFRKHETIIERSSNACDLELFGASRPDVQQPLPYETKTRAYGRVLLFLVAMFAS